jgi:uncharacterized protein YqgC (DUF456 family)
MSTLAAVIVTIAGLIGPLMAMVSLPGIWFMVLVATGCKLWQHDLFSWKTLIIAAVMALTSDIVDLVAGSVGAKRAGGTRRAAVGAMVGGISGAVAGSLMVPVIGTLLFGAAGAGLGAALAQHTRPDARWRRSLAVGSGAAAGWVVAVLFKVIDAFAVSILLIWAAYVK